MRRVRSVFVLKTSVNLLLHHVVRAAEQQAEERGKKAAPL